MPWKKNGGLAAAGLLLAVAILAACFAKRGAGRAAPEPAGPAAHVAARPGSVYRPKAEPLRRAERPALPAGTEPAPQEGADGATDGDADDGEREEALGDGLELSAAEPPVLPDDDPGLVALEPERLFAEAVWDALAAAPDERIAEASRLLSSPSPEERAFGGVLAFFENLLEGEILERVADDPDPLVPLTVLDWVRDFGTEEQAAAFREAFAARGMETDELLALAAGSRGLPGGGRSALDLYLARFGEGECPVDALSALVTSRETSYDVREQALFKLLEPETRAAGEAALRAFAAGLGPEDGVLLPFAAGKLAEVALISNPDGDAEKIWDAEAPVVFHLANAEGDLRARDLANYLEYALRRDDPEFPPIVEIGTWEFANEFLLANRERTDSFPPSELDALDRIAAALDRLVEYDPAFNPFETVEDDEEESDDEESDDEESDDEPDDEELDGEESDDEPDDEELDDDSMAGVGVQNGDLLVVDRSLEPEDGSTVIA